MWNPNKDRSNLNQSLLKPQLWSDIPPTITSSDVTHTLTYTHINTHTHTYIHTYIDIYSFIYTGFW